MAFLRINGWDIDSMIGQHEIKDVSVQSFQRNAFDQLEGNVFSTKKEITFTTPPLTVSDAYAVEGWITGKRHLFNFDKPSSGTLIFTPYSADAGLYMSGATSGATACFGNWSCYVASAGAATTTVMFGSEGDWAIHLYHRTYTTTSPKWDNHGVVSRKGVITAWLNNASAATCRVVQITTSSGFTGIKLVGYTSGGVATSCQFDHVSIMKFAATSEQFASLSSCYFGLGTTHWARPPFITVTGDGLPMGSVVHNLANELGPLYCKGFLEDVELTPCVLNGAFNKNARQLTFTLTER
jgi:hypothetical protein